MARYLLSSRKPWNLVFRLFNTCLAFSRFVPFGGGALMAAGDLPGVDPDPWIQLEYELKKGSEKDREAT